LNIKNYKNVQKQEKLVCGGKPKFELPSNLGPGLGLTKNPEKKAREEEYEWEAFALGGYHRMFPPIIFSRLDCEWNVEWRRESRSL